MSFSAHTGILAGVIGFGLYLPTIGIFLSILSVLFMAVWNILIARKLFKLSQRTRQNLPLLASARFRPPQPAPHPAL